MRPVTADGGVNKAVLDPLYQSTNLPPVPHLQPISQLKPETLIHINRSLEVRVELHLLYKETKTVQNELRNGVSVSSKG